MYPCQKLSRGEGSSSGTALLTGRAATRKMTMADYQLTVGHVPRWNNLRGWVSGSKGLKGYDCYSMFDKIARIKLKNTVPKSVQKINYMQLFSFIHLINMFLNWWILNCVLPLWGSRTESLEWNLLLDEVKNFPISLGICCLWTPIIWWPDMENILKHNV